MNSGKIVGDGTGRVDGQKMEGSTRGPRGPKKSLPAASGMENQTTSMVGEQEGPS